MACLLVPFMFSSCQKDEEDKVSFDETLLYGKWKSQILGDTVNITVYYKYSSEHSGGTWDTADDVTEAEAQAFKWTLENDQLTQIHQLEKRKINGKMVRVKRIGFTKIYKVTELTATSLKYIDVTAGGNKSNVFIKVTK